MFLQPTLELLAVRIEMAVQTLSVSETLNVLMFQLLVWVQCVGLVPQDSQEMDSNAQVNGGFIYPNKAESIYHYILL